MSWQISVSGHHTNDEDETKRVEQLLRATLAKAKELNLNPTYGSFSGNTGTNSVSEANIDAYIKEGDGP